ncbi:NAD(P)-binding domain-containing protein [Streptomyces sp. DSM 44915]|uniref:NAD(P)-binding domain-containing protein n=1 Tax=Streptomyces chisholmiae TaxID=3075540 RepID=A0ABU2JYX0_9ACTN|nr:NAD(P)-binding domain-containing protein [Streptomyces sp. DSM 44915]MDT0270137.1 NAD(P)-binding domain-containing protein [Streptomyces sp. DSM 44915]
MIITIVGAGNMARSIATRALAGEHTVRLVDHSPQKAADLAEQLRAGAPPGATPDVTQSDAIGVEGADLVVLAVPYPAGLAVAAEYGTALAGSVLVDISNPVDFATFDGLVVAAGTSAAERIAAEAAPGVPVVKAFNTCFAGTLLGGRVAGLPLDVLIAGDDEEGKRRVAELAASGGLNPLDVGPLRRARELEAFQFLHMAAQERLGLNWSSAIKILS